MSAPLVVNTTDGVVWRLRPVMRDGQPLYALADAPVSCPEFVMATYAELVEHGICGSADVLPMPVGPGPLPLSAEREAEIREWVEAMGQQKDIRYYGSWQQHGELLGEIDRLRAERAAIGNEIARFGIYGAALPAAKALVKRADELVTENGQLRARVVELERAFAEAPVSYALMERAAESADRLTAFFAPVASLREDEPAHSAPCRWPSSPDCTCAAGGGR